MNCSVILGVAALLEQYISSDQVFTKDRHDHATYQKDSSEGRSKNSLTACNHHVASENIEYRL